MLVYWMTRITITFIRWLAGILYGMRIIGEENLPPQGPAIISGNEIGFMGVMASASVMGLAMAEKKIQIPLSFADEGGWMMGANKVYELADSHPVLPQGRGRGAGTLLQCLRHLQAGGTVLLNPEGEMTWDGRMAPIHNGLGWLALRTGAPIVLIVTTYGAYEVWPKWARWPHLRGRFDVIISEPIYVTDKSVERVSPELMAAANKRLQDEFNRLIYGQSAARRYA